jgi:GAF domain-containing protein
VSDEQSVQPQQALDELGRIRLAEHSLESVLGRVATLALRTVPGATDVSVTVVDRGRATTAAFTGQVAVDLDERQYEHGRGPCLDCIAGGEPVRISDMEAEDRWPEWAAAARGMGIHSSLSVPVPLQREISAALNIYSSQAQRFDDGDVEVASTFAAYAGVALANVHLYEAQSRLAEDLQTAMQTRAVIEQAKGVLMGARRCTSDEAFDLLVKLSQDSNRKLRDVAQAIVDEAAAG